MSRDHKGFWGWLGDRFSSLRLAVVLLIILAAVSVLGTFVPQGQEPSLYLMRYGRKAYSYLKFFGVIDLYHSWGFRTITTLLGVNLLVCSLRRLRGVISRTITPLSEKTPAQIKQLRLFNELPSPGVADVLERALVEKRYRVKRSGRFMYGSKGALGPWGDMITHASILLVLLGALVGSLGFVGTVNVYEGDWTDKYYNWNTGADEPFGFRLLVENFSLEHYPADLKIAVRERASGRTVGVFETRERASFKIPDTALRVVPDVTDFSNQETTLKLYSGDKLLGIYNTGSPDGGDQAPPEFRYAFDLVSFREPVIKSVSSTVRITKGDRLLTQAIVEVNRPLKFGGLSIYQTGYTKDQEGRYYTGFQIVRDPGLPLVWAGFVLLMAGLFLSFYFYHRQVWVAVEDDRIYIGGTTNKDWKGFMREYGGVVKRFVQEVEP